ncbi:glucosidase II beta subunit-like-domain-containing protein [Scheffersomyces amazonensis]|uniref:glucosidase II beta subunit-like-domain-containing protein n=1 Tax=Scheffersomyces amazonensis TaxID=1078765 RepID=UPI00315D6F83
MRSAAIALFLIASLVSGSGSGSVSANHEVVRGVSPEEQHLYRPIVDEVTGKKTWRCLSDPTIELSYDQINDDYCDCPDGSDEPGTNACPYTISRKFYCANKHHIPEYIENYKLNDGVCDYDICCDGSDEYLSGKCEDKCKQVHDQFESYKARVTTEVDESLKIKVQWEETADKLRQQAINKLSELRATFIAKQKQFEIVKQTLEETSDEENSGDEFLLAQVDRLNHHLTEFQNDIQLKDKYIAQLEQILAKLVDNYNPNFNDAAVKESVAGFQEYITNKDSGAGAGAGAGIDQIQSVADELKQYSLQISSHSETETPQVVQVPTFGNMLRHYYGQLRDAVNFEQNTYLNNNDNGNGNRNPILYKYEKELEDIGLEIETIELDLEKNYGPKDILRALKSTWVNTKIGDYMYKLGFLDAIYQGNNLIGRFDGFSSNQMTYSNGAKCWNGPSRSAIVNLVCGPSNGIVSVSEPEKCQYVFELITPIACQPVTEEGLLSTFQVDLSKL